MQYKPEVEIMEIETMDLETLNSEQLEVYKYLIDGICTKEKAYNIVNNYEFSIYNSFEDCVNSYIENCGCTLPEFVRLDLVQMWRESFVHSDNYVLLDARKDFEYYPDTWDTSNPLYIQWEDQFYETINVSRFLEVYI